VVTLLAFRNSGRRAHRPVEVGKYWKIQGRNGVTSKVWLLQDEGELL